MTQMPPPSEPMTPMQPHRGVMILVFSILSWVLSCVIFGIVAWILANKDLRAMEEGRMDPTGEGLTKAGKIVAIINVVVNIVGVVAALLFVLIALLVAGAAAASGAGGP